MPIITDNQLQGNYAAAYVTARLSAHCLVRPVAADTDVGVDLYCETLERRQPFLHFWVQVKSGDQCRMTADGLAASCSFRREHLEYWERQPVPVFAALVPLVWPVERDPNIFVANLTVAMISGPHVETATRSVSARQIWRPGDNASLCNFLAHDVPETTAMMRCREGIVAPVPSLLPAYVNRIPTVPVANFSTQILNQIRRTAAFSLLALYDERSLRESTPEFRSRLAEILALFDDDTHWENFAARALAAQAEGFLAPASALYDRAIASILGDPHVVQADWAPLVDRLRVRQQECAATGQS